MNIQKIFILFYFLLISITSRSHEEHHHNSLSHEKPRPLLANSIYNIESPWTNQEGKTHKLSVLRGKITVLAMTYTSCQSACPIITANMKQIERQVPEQMKDKVQFAIFSFDHQGDTPKNLKDYAKKQTLDLKLWNLFQGTKVGVQELALVLGVKYKRDANGDYEHSNIITVVDAEGLIQYQQVGLNTDPAETLATIKKINFRQ